MIHHLRNLIFRFRICITIENANWFSFWINFSLRITLVISSTPEILLHQLILLFQNSIFPKLCLNLRSEQIIYLVNCLVVFLFMVHYYASSPDKADCHRIKQFFIERLVSRSSPGKV